MLQRQRKNIDTTSCHENWACQFYANLRLPHVSLIATFFAYSSKVHISHIFPHKLAFSTAILIFFVFPLGLPIVIRFRYIDHLVANRMAPSMCPDHVATKWDVVGFKQFRTIFPPHIWCLCGPHIFKKCHIKVMYWSLTSLNITQMISDK